MQDRYDFDPGQPGYPESEILKKCDGARDFDIVSNWSKTLLGQINIKSGQATFTWTLL